MSRIYLDHAATSPLRPEARAAMEEGFAIWANPSSPHAEGRKAKAALEDARERCKRALGWDGELIFTSGASEAARLAFDQADVMHEAVSAIEHDAIHNFVKERAVAEIPVGVDGQVNLTSVAREAGPSAVAGEVVENRSLIAIQHVNSETGTMQNIGQVAEVVHSSGGLLLVDCAQSAGKMEIPKEADMVIVGAHKFGGPIGIGALLVKQFNMLTPSGGHERGYRRGTENMPVVLGMAAALEAEPWPSLEFSHISYFDERFEETQPATGHNHAHHILALEHRTMSAQALLIRLDAMGFAVSAGSACSSGTLKKSRVLDAFGVDDDTASRTIRVSLGWSTTPEELDAFAEAWNSLT
ncbi:aminotransferase class V-fold PLP-dependent enzyme [Aurantiacibacter sp. D1-12]|uniref:cysteine desulfurase family protein n=2 Tax=Aurantiacibacter sp. D1-12 TaxID=2993658 RepID=UPI00237C679E|nr:aminotransferase class V-fold PLP-dependent enzyme [Aurantiacibacter sp. D1-12]MDE1466307.1 aminotransferase class V-fold PLP-dependent enzyme [Aurantiacibacter sp. D1-12]